MASTAAGGRSTLELLRGGGTLKVARAACVTNLSTVPDYALHTVGSCSLRLLLEVGLGLNETEAELPLQQIYFRDHKSYYKLCKDIHSFLTVFLGRAGGSRRL